MPDYRTVNVCPKDSMISESTATSRIPTSGAGLQIAERLRGEVIVIDLSGWLVAGESQALYCRIVHGLIERGLIHVVVNLAGVDKIDAAGVGAIAWSYCAIVRSGGILKLLGPSSFQMQLMTLTNLATLIETYCEEEIALKEPFSRPNHWSLCKPATAA